MKAQLHELKVLAMQLQSVDLGTVEIVSDLVHVQYHWLYGYYKKFASIT